MRPLSRTALAFRLALLSAPALALAGCQPAETAKADAAARPRAVRVQAVSFEAQPVTRTFSGVVRARVETKLGFRVDGKVVQRLANVGDVVKAGQVVALLDDNDRKLQVASAQAELDAARSSLAQAEADLNRVSRLESKGWASNAASDRQTAATDEARGRVARAERALELAVNQLSYVALKADVDGVVTSASAEVGQVVKTGDPVFGLAVLGEKEVQVALPEAMLGRVRASSASVELWSEPGRQRRARLRELSPLADAATRTFAARFTIEDADDSVALGMTAVLTLSEPAADPVAHLPLSALFDDGSGPSVWVVGEDGSLTLKRVDVARYGAGDVAIRGGVAAGDKVVTLGVHKLDKSQQVRIAAAGS